VDSQTRTKCVLLGSRRAFASSLRSPATISTVKYVTGCKAPSEQEQPQQSRHSSHSGQVTAVTAVTACSTTAWYAFFFNLYYCTVQPHPYIPKPPRVTVPLWHCTTRCHCTHSGIYIRSASPCVTLSPTLLGIRRPWNTSGRPFSSPLEPLEAWM